MFCVNCGKQVPEGQRLCAECAGQQEPQQPAQQTPQQPAQQPPQQPDFEVTTPAKKSPKKPGIGKIALMAVALVLVIGIIIAIVNWGSIARFFNRTFSKPADYLADVESQNAAEAAEVLADSYAAAMDSMDVVSGGTASKSEISLEMSDSVVNMLENVLAEQGMALDLSWVKEINLTVTNNSTDTLYASQLGIGVNTVNLITVSVILDMDTLNMYLAVPELNEKYIMLDLSEIYGMDPEEIRAAMAQSVEMTSAMLELMPEAEDLEKMILTYVEIVLEHFSNVEKATQTMEVAGVKQALLEMTVELSQQDILNMATDVLQEAKTDRVIRELLTGFAEYAAQLPDVGQIDDITAQYEQAIDEAIAQVETAKAEAEGDTCLQLKTYIDDEDNIVGRTVSVEIDGEQTELYYIAVVDGKEFAFEAEIAAATVTGSGTIEHDTFTGEFVLNVFGNDFLTVEVQDLLRNEDGAVNGVLRLIPESTLLAELGLDSTVTALMGGNFALELELDGKGFDMGLQAGRETMLGVGIHTTPVKAGNIVIPEDAVEANSEADLAVWLVGMKLDQLITNMEKADVPAALVDMIRQLEGALAFGS